MPYATQQYTQYRPVDEAQERNYSLGGGGLTSTTQYRPTYTTQSPLATAPRTQLPEPSTPQYQVPQPPPGVPTQAPSPTTTLLAPTLPPGAGSDFISAPVSVPPSSLGAPKLPSVTLPSAPTLPAAPAPQLINASQIGAPALPQAPTLSRITDRFSPTAGIPGLAQAIQALMANPSRYDDQVALSTLQRLQSELQRSVNADAASRGLDYTSVPTDIFGRESGLLAEKIAEDQARTHAQDVQAALQLAMGYGAQDFGQQLATRGQQISELGFNNEAQLQDYLNRLNAAQTGFQNQLASRGQYLSELGFNNQAQLQDFLNRFNTAQQDYLNRLNLAQTGFQNELASRGFGLQEMGALNQLGQTEFQNQLANREQLLREIQTLMGIGDYSLGPLGTALGSLYTQGANYGAQAGQWGDLAGQLGALLALLRSQAQPAGAYPTSTFIPERVPFTYEPQRFGR